MSDIVRETRETRVRVALEAGSGETEVDTGVLFLDHMIRTFVRYAKLEGRVEARGDLRHHVIEDVAIVCGMAVAELGPANRRRFGDRTIPMDDALVHVSIDIGGRAFYEGPLPSGLRPLDALVRGALAVDHSRARAARDRPASRRRSCVQGAGVRGS